VLAAARVWGNDDAAEPDGLTQLALYHQRNSVPRAVSGLDKDHPPYRGGIVLPVPDEVCPRADTDREDWTFWDGHRCPSGTWNWWIRSGSVVARARSKAPDWSGGARALAFLP